MSFTAAVLTWLVAMFVMLFSIRGRVRRSVSLIVVGCAYTLFAVVMTSFYKAMGGGIAFALIGGWYFARGARVGLRERGTQ